MTEPYSLETILSEPGDKTDAWVLQDKTTGLYVTIPHPKYPGKSPIHFFISKDAAAYSGEREHPFRFMMGQNMQMHRKFC